MKKAICTIAFLFAAASPVFAQRPKNPSQQRTSSSGSHTPTAPSPQSKPFSRAQMLQFVRDLHVKAAEWKTEVDPLAPSRQDNYMSGQAIQLSLKGTKEAFNSILIMTSPSRLKILTPPKSSAFDLNYEYQLLHFVISADEELNGLVDEATADANLHAYIVRLAHLETAVFNSRWELDEEVTLRIEALAYPPGTKKPRKGTD